MSREFGSYVSGYFHDQIEVAADDCLSGSDELTRLWGDFLKEFSYIAYYISTSEAHDGEPHLPILATIEKMDILEKKLSGINSFIDPYKKVAEKAVHDAIKKKKIVFEE